MIFQTNPLLLPEIQDAGCNVLTCIWHAAIRTPLLVTPELINRYVERWERIGVLRADMMILDYNRIYSELGLPVKYRDTWDPPGYVCAENEFEHLCFIYGNDKHFTAGNGAGAVTYDPMKRSRTVQNGKLDTVRIMEIL